MESVYGTFGSTTLLRKPLLLGSAALAAGALSATGASGKEAGQLHEAGVPLLVAAIALAPLAVNLLRSTPDTYLQYTTFDSDSNMVDQQQAPLTQDANGNWEYVQLETVTDTSGYVEVQVVNNSNQNVNYDDFEVVIYRDKVLQENHYYPFGQNMLGCSWKPVRSVSMGTLNETLPAQK